MSTVTLTLPDAEALAAAALRASGTGEVAARSTARALVAAIAQRLHGIP